MPLLSDPWPWLGLHWSSCRGHLKLELQLSSPPPLLLCSPSIKGINVNNSSCPKTTTKNLRPPNINPLSILQLTTYNIRNHGIN